MKPIYSICDLARLLDRDVHDIKDALIAANCRCVSEGKPANFSKWARRSHVTENNVVFIIDGRYPVPNPSHVIVNTDDLPVSWKETINEAEKRESEVVDGERGRKWPWGDYETDLLRKLATAADRFWKLYDPADNTTAPTNQQVTDWLKQHGVADRTAEVMATILRADGLPTGPRK